MDPATVKPEDFEKVLLEKFSVKRLGEGDSDKALDGSPGGNLNSSDIELIVVDRHERIREMEGENTQRIRSPFSLLFTGAEEHFYGGGMYTLTNANVGQIDVFLQPVTVGMIRQPDDAPPGFHYEVVFG